MTGMLASVNSLDEALKVLRAGVDIIDLKQPSQGALGALDTKVVTEIVTAINAQRPISATIGDLPMQADIVLQKVTAMAVTGVNYIKIGFFPHGDWPRIIAELATAKPPHLKIIAVLFADTQPDFAMLEQLAEAGFHGVMLDTMNKQKGALTEVMPTSDIAKFIQIAEQRQLLCGLAGSLRAQDIPELLALAPDYLGFRGALCRQHQRTSALDVHAVYAIKATLTELTRQTSANIGSMPIATSTD